MAVPSRLAHRVVDFATNKWVRKVIDRKWFCPTVFVSYQIARKVWRNFIYQPFVRPWGYLRRRPKHIPPQPAAPTPLAQPDRP